LPRFGNRAHSMPRLPSFEELLLGARGVERYMRVSRRSQYWTSDHLHAYRTRRIARLLGEAAVNVPYYRNLFRQVGFVPARDFADLPDLAKLPILSKVTARARVRELEHQVLARRAVVRSTSGSTGEPFRVKVSFAQRYMERATVLRAWTWAG